MTWFRHRRPRGRILTDRARETLGHIALSLGALAALVAAMGLAERLNLITP